MKIIILSAVKAELFSQVFQNIKVMAETITIEFSERGLFLQTMDSSHVSIIELKIPADWFDGGYTVQQSTQIGLSVGLFAKILSTRDKSQCIVLETEDVPEKLRIRFYLNELENLYQDAQLTTQMLENPTATTTNQSPAVPPIKSTIFNKEFEISLMEIDAELLQIPDTEYETEMTLSSFHFSQLIHQLQLFGDNMDFKCTEENIQLISKSNEKGSMMVSVNIDDLSEYSIIEDGKISVSFSLRYLNNICTFFKLAKNVRVKISQEMPMKVVYWLGEDERTVLEFYLAPKIGDGEDEE